MKTFMVGVLIGSVLSSVGAIANEWDVPYTPLVPVVPFVTPFGGYPPSLNTLPPMPSPHWEHLYVPC